MPKKRIEADPDVIRAFFQDDVGAGAALVNRQCHLDDYQERQPPSFTVSGDFIAYASPESTYAVTKPLLDAAKRSILIGIYDFTAGYMKEVLLQAMRRGVEVTLMLDLDGRTGEQPLFDELARFGTDAVSAPSCANPTRRFFSSSHEKVIVIDDAWTLVQSGNYSDNSIPLNETDGGDPANFAPGNRDMGVAVRSKKVAAFFTEILRADINLVQGEAVRGFLAGLALPDATLLAAAPSSVPPQRFPSRRFARAKKISITPVLSPDNYMAVVPGLLRSATRSILIEQQYIRPQQPAIRELLTAIRETMDQQPGLDVRIILARPIGSRKDIEKEGKQIKQLGTEFGLKVGSHIRLLSKKHFVHCHNKLIVVDGERVLVGSQNWSDSAVLKNREASLLLEFPAVAAYFAEIFEADWVTGQKTLGQAVASQFFATASLSAGGLVRLSPGDYDEV